MRNPPIPSMPCFACGIMTNETQSVYGIAHYRCFKDYNPRYGKWLPIESAPKDNTEILLYAPKVYEDGYPIPQKPTHWMPMPPPPTST